MNKERRIAEQYRWCTQCHRTDTAQAFAQTDAIGHGCPYGDCPREQALHFRTDSLPWLQVLAVYEPLGKVPDEYPYEPKRGAIYPYHLP